MSSAIAQSTYFVMICFFSVTVHSVLKIYVSE